MADTQSDSKRVLLAEDDPMIRNLIQQSLHLWGYRVFSVGNGSEAMEFAEEYKCQTALVPSGETNS